MRRPAWVPVPAGGQENDVVARSIAAQSAARRCLDAAEEIYPTTPEAPRDTSARDASARGASGRERLGSREATYAGSFHSA